ncbi:MAG: fibronectin type III domain-containing protein, partial [Anaerolineae bacterium]|nr:fibronectin type III domain-containing protein [Anaerolineae bacterium]
DLRLFWDADWGSYKRSMNLGELRELYDSDPAVALPGMLVEIAYHDLASDTDALKEPNFERVAARAVVQGLVKYFEQRDGVDLTLFPEPPTQLAVQNRGDGQVRISWQAPAADSSGLAGESATGYRVYTSPNGVGWADAVTATGATEYTLSGLDDGELVFVRVTSINAGGESFPTETLAARAGEYTGVLIVNGFDQISRYYLVPDVYERLGEVNMRMLLDQMNSYDYIVQHGTAIALPFDSASNEAVTNGPISLSDYDVTDWILGEEWESYQTLSLAERSALRSYLEGGGALFISGAELGWTLVQKNIDPTFYTDYIRASYVADDAETYQASPTAGGIFDGLPAFRFDAPGEYDVDYPDVMTGINGSDVSLVYQGGTGGAAGIQYANGCERVVHLGFPFETIHPDSQAGVMGRVMAFLGECLDVPPSTTIVSPIDSMGYLETPPFQGIASAINGVNRVEVAVIRDSDGACWDGVSWGVTEWHVASGTTAWSFAMPAELGLGVYTTRARAVDSGGVADPVPAEARFARV